MSQTWDILLVDDEPDVHEVTRLALKRKRWRKRTINLVSAYSRAEAEQIIASHPRPFHVGIIDVVMETDDAGLELCKFVRSNCPRSFRIVLRTGQPGVAPEEFVLNEYDIDYYLAKGEATPARVFSVLRACLRSSEDISMLVAYSGQLQDFARDLGSPQAMQDMLGHMGSGLHFLEFKHQVACSFASDATKVDDPASLLLNPAVGVDAARLGELATQLAAAPDATLALHPGPALGLPAGHFVIPFSVGEPSANGPVVAEDKHSPDAASGDSVCGALCTAFGVETPTDKDLGDFFADARLFLDNWRIAYGTLQLQQRLASEMQQRAQGELTTAVMEKELEVASAVQASLVPDGTLLHLCGLHLAGFYQPATQCGGDWWAYLPLDEGKLLLLIADVTGHGAGAAMVTAVARGAATTIVSATEGRLDVTQLLNALNGAIHGAAHGKYMMTCFAAIYDPSTRTFTYANAGHNFPYLFAGGKLTALMSRGRRLGETPDLEFDVRETQVAPETLLILYTDGITELPNAEGEDLGEGQFRRWIKKNAQPEPDGLRDTLVSLAQRYAGGQPPRDDVTLVVGRFD